LKEESNATDLAVRIREIETRIASLRSGIESDHKPAQATQVTSSPDQVTTVSAANDLKAKLLAKRKNT